MRPPLGGFWAKLIPFAVWVWVTNWLINLFMLVDRYMIVHFSGRNYKEALALVGQYHTARIIPLLMLTLAGSISAMLTPFLRTTGKPAAAISFRPAPI